jgi:hypothetical protein
MKRLILMQKSIYIICGIFLFVLGGCGVTSIHPLYTEQDIIFDPALLGDWTEKDSKGTWTFTKSGEKVYNLEYIDEKGKNVIFEVHLLKLENRLFLDLFPKGPEIDENYLLMLNTLPVHCFMRIEQIEPTLRLSMLDNDWLKKFLQEHPDAVRHEQENDRIILTAEPKELQAFLMKIDDIKEAYIKTGEKVRPAEQENEQPIKPDTGSGKQ